MMVMPQSLNFYRVHTIDKRAPARGSAIRPMLNFLGHTGLVPGQAFGQSRVQACDLAQFSACAQSSLRLHLRSGIIKKSCARHHHLRCPDHTNIFPKEKIGAFQTTTGSRNTQLPTNFLAKPLLAYHCLQYSISKVNRLTFHD